MKLSDYFSEKTGLGVISTADSSGEVNSAIYAKPHVNGPDEIAFIMLNKRTRANLKENPRASYLFVESGNGYVGVRLKLTMTGETDDKELIASLSRRDSDYSKDRFLATFRVDKVIKLVGDEEMDLE